MLTVRSLLLVASSASLISAEVGRYSLPAPWSWECDTSNSSVKVTGLVVEAQCVKTSSSLATKVQSLMACKMTCDKAGVIWPAPTGQVSLSKELLNFLPHNLKVVAVLSPSVLLESGRSKDISLSYQYYVILIRWQRLILFV